VSKLSNAIISIFRKGEKRVSSEQFEQAVNQVLLSDTVADATKKPLTTPEAASLKLDDIIDLIKSVDSAYARRSYLLTPPGNEAGSAAIALPVVSVS